MLHTLLYKLQLYPAATFKFKSNRFKCIVKEVAHYVQSVASVIAEARSRVNRVTVAVFPRDDACMGSAVDVEIGALHLLDDNKAQDVVDAILRTPFPEAAVVESRTWRLLVETNAEEEEIPVEMLATVEAQTEAAFQSLKPSVTPITSLHDGDRLVITCNFTSFDVDKEQK